MRSVKSAHSAASWLLYFCDGAKQQKFLERISTCAMLLTYLISLGISSSCAWNANPFENPKLMQSFVQIKDYERQSGSEMEVPSIVVVGVESAGKSTLLSAIVGLPLTHTHSKTGTRCPVRYRLRYGQDAQDPQVKLQGAAPRTNFCKASQYQTLCIVVCCSDCWTKMS